MWLASGSLLLPAGTGRGNRGNLSSEGAPGKVWHTLTFYPKVLTAYATGVVVYNRPEGGKPMDEDEKHAAQTAFLSAENVSNFYQQIIEQGYLGENLTRQIAEDISPEVKQPEIDQPEIQRE